MSRIHPTAVVHPNAIIAETVEIGPYAVIGESVTIGENTAIYAHSTIEGRTAIGRDNKIGPHAAIGGVPQDKKYAGEPTRLEIGDRNTIREFTSIHIGTVQGGGLTKLGDDNWIMGQTHIAHDCIIGNSIIMANFVGLAGHVTIEDHVFLGGYSGVHQFCRIGIHAMTAISSVIVQDVLPYTVVGNTPIRCFGIHREGLRRAGFSAETVGKLKRAYRIFHRSGLSQTEALEQLAPLAAGSPEVARFVEFITTSARGITR
jgi:UDP-N-acetylglucosamine acyltransferase